jgi:hypothetical protein
VSDRHERFMAKNLAMGRAWESEARDKAKDKVERTPATPQMAFCDRCKKEKLCLPFRTHQTDRTEGAASYGTVIKQYCEDCRPKPKHDDKNAPALDKKQVKNLLKDAKKFLR